MWRCEASCPTSCLSKWGESTSTQRRVEAVGKSLWLWLCMRMRQIVTLLCLKNSQRKVVSRNIWSSAFALTTDLQLRKERCHLQPNGTNARKDLYWLKGFLCPWELIFTPVSISDHQRDLKQNSLKKKKEFCLCLFPSCFKNSLIWEIKKIVCSELV